MKTVCSVVAIVITMWTSGMLAAQERRAAVVERIQELNLTEEQEAKLAEIQQSSRPKVEAAAKELAGLVKEEVDKAMAVLYTGAEDEAGSGEGRSPGVPGGKCLGKARAVAGTRPERCPDRPD